MTGEINRLPPGYGRFIDRRRPINFVFERRKFSGFAGDSIASALAAGDQWILSRSFKYRRPRGVLTMAGQDANTLVQVESEPNVLADRRAIEPGLVVTGQNYDGSLEADRGAVLELFSRFLPVGFYYKAFYRRGSWKFWEAIIRQRAGLGRIGTDAPRGYFDKQYLFADVAVVGGGPAGLAAARQAAAGGADVILIDEWPLLGGSLSYARIDRDGAKAGDLAGQLAEEVTAETNIRVMSDAVCTGWFADNWLAIVKGSRFYKLRAKAVVIATGSLEQPAVFRNNDLPGVMNGTAAQRLIRLYGVRPGSKAVVIAGNDDAYGVALDLLEAGTSVQAVVDLRERAGESAMVRALRGRGVPILEGHAVTEAIAATGKHGIIGASVARIDDEGRTDGANMTFECDLLCTSTGYSPAGQLLHHAGTRFTYDHAANMFAPAILPAHVFAAGSVNGTYRLDAVLGEGRRAGWAAARDAGRNGGPEPVPVTGDRGAVGQTHGWPIFPHKRGRDFVDFDEDLQVKDLVNGIADGYDDIELLKRYSTVGMGPSQGRHSAVAAVRVLARETRTDLSKLSVTTQRPPYMPEKFGHLAGRAFEPERHTPMHHGHYELGARMMLAGSWYRPAFYGKPGERDEAIREEVLAVRNNVGLIDVSTLGGLDIRGPDAAEFLNRLYTFAYAKQPVGRSRYVLMCDQSGAIIDDGVACRLNDEHFYVTATTGGVDAVYRLMLQWNAQWRLDVDVANVTAAYAAVNIAGPRSRDVLAQLCRDVELSPSAFPYMGVRLGTVAGIPARILRVGFVGELGYEIHVPASQGEALWDLLMGAGAAAGIRPFGVEAQRVLRLEKGHIIIGQDTDGLTHPHEADMAWAIAAKKAYFMGGRSIAIQMARPLTRKLVGFTVEDAGAPVPEECHLTIRGSEIVGRVTSAVRSPALERTVGLAYVAPDQAEPGTSFDIRVQDGRIIEGKVVPIPFYDPENKRQEI
ncbi:MAG: sarcosine oxidase, subunit alpha [Rhodospirillaceae bacterium]|nr:sarcosine oxidase, subunit alpha [Rhodospirillaceae bacterium]